MSSRLPAAFTFCALLGLSTCALSACDAGIYQSSGGIRLDGSHVEFVVCEPIDGARLLVFGVERHGEKDSTYMEASGEVHLQPSVPLSSAGIPDGLDASVWIDPVVPPGARVSLFVYEKDGDVVFPIEFDIPEDGLSGTLWTRSNGSQNVDACE